MRSTRGQQKRQDSDECDEVGSENLICTMRGNNWEASPYPIIVDSGASASTLPKGWCNHVKFWEIEESRSGQGFNAANGQTIANLGRRSATLMTKGDVTRALGPVSQLC